MKKYQNKYRISSARAPFWDYGWNAAYFVTICTQNRVCWFGEIVEAQNFSAPKQMQLSESGKIAHQCWQEIPDHFPFVKLGAFVIMPDHVHGIVIIDKPDDGRNNNKNNLLQRRKILRLCRILRLCSSKKPTNQKTNSVPNPKIWHPLSVDSKLGLPKMPGILIRNLRGNPDITIILSVMVNPMTIFPNTL